MLRKEMRVYLDNLVMEGAVHSCTVNGHTPFCLLGDRDIIPPSRGFNAHIPASNHKPERRVTDAELHGDEPENGGLTTLLNIMIKNCAKYYD